MSYARLTKVLAVVLAMTFVVPTSISLIRAADDKAQVSSVTYVRIYVPGARSEVLAPYNVDIVETYDEYVLAKIGGDQLSALQRANINVEEMKDLFNIDLKAGVFDVRDGEPAVPAELRIDSYPAQVKGYYIVQFLGPVKDEWKWQLESRGAEVLRYVPNDAFLVRMTPEARDSISSLRTVVWTGIYHPAYRIDPSLYGAVGIVPVEIVTFQGAPVAPVVAYLNHQGYGGAEFGGTEPGVISYYQGSISGVVRARIEASLIPAIARLFNVEFVEPYSEPTTTNYYAQSVHQTDAVDPTQSSARKIWNMGIRGQGQIVSVADTGMDYDHNMFRESDTVVQTGDIYNVTDYNRRKVIRYLPMANYSNVDPLTDPEAWKDSLPGNVCTSGHGTATTGIIFGNDDPVGGVSLNDGMAKDAQIFFEDIGTVGPSTRCGNMDDDLLSYIPDDLNLMLGPAYAAGARIHSNSWGGGTANYALSSMQIDEFVWKHPDMLVVFAQGNDGGTYGSVQEQATAKNTLSAGGARPWPGENGMVAYSAWGPTADGRQKPTVTFVSEGVTSMSDGDPLSSQYRDLEWTAPTFSGTSYAAPDAAGHAALVRQYFTDGWYPTGAVVASDSFEPQASLVTATLVASSAKMTASSANPGLENRWPNDAQGWGRPLLDNGLYFQGDTRYLSVQDDRAGLKTGQWEEYQYNVIDSNQMIKFIVAWTDYPGTVGAAKALVNNIDIVVTAPNATTYKGNVWDLFRFGQSRTGGSADTINNIEGVIINKPPVGVWTLRVSGTNVPVGPQPYSIAVVGGIDTGYGQVFLDRHTYSESDVINIKVVDTNAAGSVTVNLTSTTEPWEEEVQLNETGNASGVFTGSITTSFGTPLANGIVEVSDGDTINVLYSDLVPAHDAYAHAVVEAVRPMIYNVKVQSITSSTATVTWLTNVPADSWVYYNTSTTLDNVRTSSELVISHALTLVNLQTDTLYFFDVASSDGKGHRTLDDNSGTHYAFKTTAKGEILVVLGDETYEQKRPEGVLAYRQSLTAYGWSYNEWHVKYSGPPSLSLMQTYKAVIWQVGMEEYPPHTDEELQLIADYLDQGGRLFYVHHDTFWAYCAVLSSWMDAAKCGWTKSILKATFKSGNPNNGDPTLIDHVVGVGADPISDIYAQGNIPGPAVFVPFRSGGAADEVDPLFGPPTTVVWTDYGGGVGGANEDPISVKWISPAANGTLGVGVWGGYRSRMVGFYANWIDIDYNAGVTLSSTRADILNKTIVWLIERDHPDVLVTAPNGGEVVTTDSVQINWTRMTYGGTSVGNQAAFYSADGGQSWFPINTTIAPSNTTHPWYLTSLCNGQNFMVRIQVFDDGTPVFSAYDDSNSTFTINRPSGDCGGPRVWAGSASIEPNPIMYVGTAYVNATVDDTVTGNSNIDPTRPAEFFIDTIGADGTGWGMNLTSPPTSPVEAVGWSGSLNWLSFRCYTIYVHGQDVLGQWGPFENNTFCVQDVPPQRPPRAPKSPNAELVNSANDVRITWVLSPDDPANLDHYEVWYSVNVYDKAKGASYQFLGNSPPGQGYYVHSGVGRDANSYFYYVKAVNPGGSSNTVDQVAKFARSLSVGMQLVSVPVTVINWNLQVVLQTLTYDSARWYDPLNAVDPWLSYKPGRTFNDFTTARAGMGLWVHVTAAGVFAVAGKIPVATQVRLQSGWNLVGFTSFSKTYTYQQLLVSVPGCLLEAYDSAKAPYYLKRITYTGFNLSAGSGYWIYVGSTTNWVVSN